MGEMNLRDCLIYLDDVIVFSSTFEEHLERLEAVFTRLQEHNLELKASKCRFLKSRLPTWVMKSLRPVLRQIMRRQKLSRHDLYQRT